MPRNAGVAAIISGALLLVGPASAELWIPPETVPVGRLIADTERHLAAHPDDAEALDTLGRLQGGERLAPLSAQSARRMRMRLPKRPASTKPASV
jgi:hypothetical protein